MAGRPRGGALRDALGRPALRSLLGAGLVSLTGDWVVRVGLAYAVYALTRRQFSAAARGPASVAH